MDDRSCAQFGAEKTLRVARSPVTHVGDIVLFWEKEDVQTNSNPRQVCSWSFSTKMLALLSFPVSLRD
jgi:hypothetical protein